VSAGHRLEGVEAVTFDFGNTLVPIDRAGLRRVVERTAEQVATRLGPFTADSFLAAWAEERERQFREEVPRFREVDLADRFVRVLARLRGMSPPPRDGTWDQAAAERHSTSAEIDWAVDVYSGAFVDVMPVPPAVGPLLERLAQHRRLAILSNWPLATTIDRFVEAAGWARHFRAIFAAALGAIGGARPEQVLHVGDDWAADVVGAKRAGWRAAFLDARPADSPLPDSVRGTEVEPDLEIAALAELETALAPRRRRAPAGGAGQ
jgi:FMN phosphatase YigB (HAD superfamily)